MRPKYIAAVLVTLVAAGACSAGEGEEQAQPDRRESIGQRDTLTDDWFGLGKSLEEGGVTINLGLTEVYQINTHGGLSTDRRKGRESGSYDLEITLDLDKLISLPGGTIYMGAEGNWAGDMDRISVGSLFGVNRDAAAREREIDVRQLYYEQFLPLLDETLRIRVGKVDLTGGFQFRGGEVMFDGNAFANDETGQFMNSALVNNPTIPFPDVGLGLVVYYREADSWYISGGIADAQADARETGFNTAFHGEAHFFSIVEAGVMPRAEGANGRLPGTLRVGVWYDPRDKTRNSGSTKRSDMAVYFSADQVMLKENSDEEDTQGLGVFGRLGYADHDVSVIRFFWSAGAQYRGLVPSRDDDVVAFGVAQGRLTRSAGSTEPHETAMEVYYNTAITDWLSITPSVQYIINPGGVNTVKDAVVFGLRLQMTF